MKPKKNAEADVTPAPVAVTALTDIFKLCCDVKTLELTIDQKVCKVNFRRLTGAENSVLETLADEVMPPITKGDRPELDRVDYTNPEFLKAKRASQQTIQALALYWCIADLQAMKPGLKAHAEITEFVQGSFPPAVLQAMYQAVNDNPIDLAQIVNFTSSSGSPKS